MKKLAIISSHPIQYNAPLFKLLAERENISLKIFYTWSQASEKLYDPGFGKERKWDIPLFESYKYEFVDNVSGTPGSHHFKGIDNPLLVKRIEEWGATEILVYGWNFKSHLNVMRHFKGKVPVWFRGDSTLLDEKKGFSFKKILRRIVLKNIYRHIDKAFYTGKANKEYFLKHGVKPANLVYAPHAIDNIRFSMKDEGKIAEQKATLSIKQNEIVFLFAGKLEPKKDPLLLIEAFIEASVTNCHLIIAGDGILKNEIIQLLDRNEQNLLSMKKKIHLLPFQNQSAMPGLYKMADIFVLPSKGPGETWGLAVNEAMASGLAVIVSNKCGCAEDLVGDNITGFIFRAGDKKDLADKMESMSSSGKRLFEMKKAAREKINKFSILHIADAIENTLLVKD